MREGGRLHDGARAPLASLSPAEMVERAEAARARARSAKVEAERQRRLARREWRQFEFFRAALEEMGIQVVVEQPNQQRSPMADQEATSDGRTNSPGHRHR